MMQILYFQRSKIKMKNCRVAEMAQELRPEAVLPEDLASITSSHSGSQPSSAPV